MQHADSYETTWVAPPAEEVYVEITTQSVVIDVLYGLDLPGLRITPDASRSCWVIEREGITPGEYTPWHTVPTRKEEARRLEEDEANLPIMVRALLAAERQVDYIKAEQAMEMARAGYPDLARKHLGLDEEDKQLAYREFCARLALVSPDAPTPSFEEWAAARKRVGLEQQEDEANLPMMVRTQQERIEIERGKRR